MVRSDMAAFELWLGKHAHSKMGHSVFEIPLELQCSCIFAFNLLHTH
jgi:hypothetical protein